MSRPSARGLEALRLLREGLNAVVLFTDFAMPGMTGVDLAREAVLLRPELNVLLITGYANVSDREAAGPGPPGQTIQAAGLGSNPWQTSRLAAVMAIKSETLVAWRALRTQQC